MALLYQIMKVHLKYIKLQDIMLYLNVLLCLVTRCFQLRVTRLSDGILLIVLYWRPLQVNITALLIKGSGISSIFSLSSFDGYLFSGHQDGVITQWIAQSITTTWSKQSKFFWCTILVNLNPITCITISGKFLYLGTYMLMFVQDVITGKNLGRLEGTSCFKYNV
jgi:hypothetical protein